MTDVRFAILATSEDAQPLATMLRERGHACELLEAAELIVQIARGEVTALFACAEELGRIDLPALKGAIAAQPDWSDLPVLLLVRREEAVRHAALMDELGQVRLIERPLDPFIVERSALAALRSRGRQQGARALIEKVREAEARYRELSATLERRVAEASDALTAAYAARLEAEERYRLAARATDDAVWDLDLVSDTIIWSDSESEVFGYANVGGSTSLGWWEERVHPEDREAVSASLLRAIEEGETHWSARYRFRAASGDYADVHDRGFIIRDESGRGVRAVGAMADVTERLRAEAERRRLEAELVHVSRLSAMGAMASTLAHELNQPLTAVVSYVRGSRRLIADAPGEDVARAGQALESAEESAHRAGQIVRRLRELVERGSVDIKAEDLPTLIEEATVIGFVDEHLLGVSHRLEFDPAARWVEADRIQVQQVLINLVRNSVDAMAGQPRREVVIRTLAAADMVEVSVADTGPGVPPDMREMVFTPFHTDKPEGMGIGLSISRAIVEAHGGRIWAEADEGGGAVFRFTLPRAAEMSRDNAAAA